MIPEEVQKEQAAVEKAVTTEGFRGEWTTTAPRFTGAQPEMAN